MQVQKLRQEMILPLINMGLITYCCMSRYTLHSLNTVVQEGCLYNVMPFTDVKITEHPLEHPIATTIIVMHFCAKTMHQSEKIHCLARLRSLKYSTF